MNNWNWIASTPPPLHEQIEVLYFNSKGVAVSDIGFVFKPTPYETWFAGEIIDMPLDTIMNWRHIV